MQLDALALRMRPRAPLEAADLGVRLCQARGGLRLCVLCRRLRSRRRARARCVRDRELASDAALVLVQAVARPHDTVRAVARGVRAGDDGQATLGSAGPGLGRTALPDVDLAALVAVALVHATRLPARGLALRQDPAARQAGAAPQRRHRAVDDAGVPDGGELPRLHRAVVARLACAGRQRPSLEVLLFDPGQRRSRRAAAVAYAVVVAFLEPFYVAAGFAMYLNRRAELEAWDVEQELRRAFAS